jgi:peptidoglycan/LPS O-acetylase OafA/YrhL
MASIGYRPEVDGLRGVAVAAIVWAHAGAPGLSGGFLGVDVFFVVSGFLITSILMADLRAGRFSLVGFYHRRMRRIIPALNVMLLLCLPVAVAFMLPGNLENFGQSVVATVLFANNALLWKTAGYFDIEAQFKPLLHTWSLGVEEQYYLVAPLMLWGLFRLGGARAVPPVLAAISLASFAASLWLARADPAANFYLPFSRAWELGLGGLAAFAAPAAEAWRARRPRLAEAIAAAGLAAVAAGLLLIGPSMATPGPTTLAPVLGTAAIIVLARPGGGAGRLLAWPPLVGVGLISYSLYLFHQPVFVFARIVSLEPPPPWLMGALTAGVVALAWLSWRFVERPFRDRRTPRWRVAAFCLVTSAILAATGLALHLNSGFGSRFPELAGSEPGFGPRRNQQYNSGPNAFAGAGFAPGEAAPNVLVIGNSFGRDLINMGLEAGALRPGRISYEPTGDAFPAVVTPGLLGRAARADLILIASDYGPADIVEVRRGRAALARASAAPILVIGTKSFGHNNDAVMRLPAAERYARRARPPAEVVERNAAARRAFGPAYVDLMAMIGDGEGRVPVFTPDRRFISQDTRHLTEAGALWLGRIVFADPRLSEPLQGPPSG